MHHLISAVIITFNEELNIERCIKSVQVVADEVLILDSFSSDKTVEDEIKKALKLIIRKNKPAGIIALSNEGGIQRFSQGFDFVAVAHDAHFISKELNSLKSQFSEYIKKI